MSKFEKKQTIKEWEVETGIEIKNPKGFYGKRSEIWRKLYTKKQFFKASKASEIRCKTLKGLEFLGGSHDKNR